MDINLHAKNALVCGSTKGIGRAAAIELSKLGANVTLMARNNQQLEETLNLLDQSNGQQHSFLTADFSDNRQVASVIRDNCSFHILINNTGGPPGGLAIDAGLDEFRNAFQSHLLNNQTLTQAVVPFMKKEGYGRIVNIISTSVKIPIRDLGVSNTIRGAVASWAKTLASELGSYGITVNNVLPGATNTGRLQSIIENKAKNTSVDIEQVEAAMKQEIPAGRFALPEEVGSVIAFLATPAASYINGINIPVDGGRTGCL